MSCFCFFFDDDDVIVVVAGLQHIVLKIICFFHRLHVRRVRVFMMNSERIKTYNIMRQLINQRFNFFPSGQCNELERALFFPRHCDI